MSHSVVAIAGASGFVGTRLIESMADSQPIVALSRGLRPNAGSVEWRACDLFSLKQTEKALAGAKVAVYLVHSMMPHARLIQGQFEDFDVIIADNFVRACKSVGVTRIIYLGGIIPKGPLSRHLASRLEVERVLSSYGIDVTVVRAGLIVGQNGSSFGMMVNLVKRLPVMLCPVWTTSLGQPSSVEDTVSTLCRLVSDELKSGVWDIGGPDKISYLDMMRCVSDELKVRRRFFRVPFLSVGLSRLWVSLVTGYPKELVAPLIQSLKSPMLVENRNLFEAYGMKAMSFPECVRNSLKPSINSSVSFKGNVDLAKVTNSLSAVPTILQVPRPINLVCSMQRLHLPAGRDVKWVAREYERWVVRFLFPLVKVDSFVTGDFDFSIRMFILFGPRLHLLRLRYEASRSSDSRQLFYIRGGILLAKGAPSSGRLEFRKLPGAPQVMAAIFDFKPSLPWWIYKFTQALAHLWVMNNFGRHLASIFASERS